MASECEHLWGLEGVPDPALAILWEGHTAVLSEWTDGDSSLGWAHAVREAGAGAGEPGRPGTILVQFPQL